VILSFQVRQKLSLANRLDEKDKLRFIAEAGIQRGFMEFKINPMKSYDSLSDGWSNNPSSFKDIEVGDGEFSLLYDYADKKSGLIGKRYGFIDEERKLNINKIDFKVLARLFKTILSYDDYQAEELAACIKDWRTSGSELSIPEGSAKNSYYEGLQFPYDAKNSDFEVLDELLLVKDVDDNVFDKIKDYVTIYGDGKVNINTASEPVLSALGLDKSIIRKIMLYRAGEDGIEGTSDDNYFANAFDIVPKLSQVYSLSGSEVDQLSMVVSRYLVTYSNNFMIKAVASSKGRNPLEVTSVINRNGMIFYWREG